MKFFRLFGKKILWVAFKVGVVAIVKLYELFEEKFCLLSNFCALVTNLLKGKRFMQDKCHFHLFKFSRPKTNASGGFSRLHSSFYCTYRISGAAAMFLFSYHSTHARIDHKVWKKIWSFREWPPISISEPIGNSKWKCHNSDCCAIGDFFISLIRKESSSLR